MIDLGNIIILGILLENHLKQNLFANQLLFYFQVLMESKINHFLLRDSILSGIKPEGLFPVKKYHAAVSQTVKHNNDP